MNTTRTIRVFISSTFRDMQAERDYLVKFTFPQLRKLCESRGVTWGEVDLRWGITDEEKAEGKVLPLCLEEIHRCRPYFIGLLGERYGWIPDSIPEDIIEREPWLREHLHQHKSVTELEILHGVINNPEMADHSFFYFRDPDYVQQVPAETRSDFTSEDAESAKKLRELKVRIRHNHFPVRENYADPKALGELVLKDFTELIAGLYPAGEEPEPLDREAADHGAFAQSRARVYIGRQGYFDRLDRHVEGDGPPLVVLGESGSGKSALLANWSAQYQQNNPDAFVIQHYIGATPYSADLAAMLRRIMGEFKRRSDIQQDIPDKPDELREAFANWLHMAAAKGKVVLILDALNQLEDRDGAPDLVWLPPVIPSNVRLILSTLPGRALDDLNKRSWPTMGVKPLVLPERKQLISNYLAQYTKALSPVHAERIAGADQTANPLYLRAFLEELRVFGIHEELDDRIEHYLNAATIPELYEKILERYEQDYERDRPEMVQDTMKLLWASRRGLSETEMLELLGTDKGPLPRAYWSPLYLAAESSLVSRSGLIGFGHHYLRQAVRDKYLPVERRQQVAHLRLADYFTDQPLNTRKVDELPWQCAAMRSPESWRRLYELLANLPFFDAAWNSMSDEVQAYWARIEENSSLRVVDAYRSVLDAPGFTVDVVLRLADLLGALGYPRESLQLRDHMVVRYRQDGDRTKLAQALLAKAKCLHAGGDNDYALGLLDEAEQIYRGLNDNNGLQWCLQNQASILSSGGELERAMAKAKEQEEISRQFADRRALEGCLFAQGEILYQLGRGDDALDLFREQEQICRAIGNKDGLMASLFAQASTLAVHRRDFETAMARLQEHELICRELGYRDKVAESLAGQANILDAQGDIDSAMQRLKEAYEIYDSWENESGRLSCLEIEARILHDSGNLEGVLSVHRRAEQLSRESGDQYNVQVSLLNQAITRQEQGDLSGASLLVEEGMRICRNQGFNEALSMHLRLLMMLQESQRNL